MGENIFDVLISKIYKEAYDSIAKKQVARLKIGKKLE